MGGAMAYLFYAEPLVTYDLDVFVILPKPVAGLLTLTTLYEWLSLEGREAEVANVRPSPIETTNCLCAVMEFESVMVTVNVRVPAAVGAPANAPVGTSKVRPSGSEPAVTDQL